MAQPLNKHETSPLPSLYSDFAPMSEKKILQLELEEKQARKSKLDEYAKLRHQKSCVSTSNIFQSSRNVLNQYHRFSLDGKGSMYGSPSQNFTPMGFQGRRSISSSNEPSRFLKGVFITEPEKATRLPPNSVENRVIWCKPGVVAKLMGLEAIPVPVYCTCDRKFELHCCKISAELKDKTPREDFPLI